MSENQEFNMNKEVDPMAVLPQGKAEGVAPSIHRLHSIEESIDSQTYFLGEVPQAHLVDPCAYLPLNSDRLVGSINVVEKLVFEAGLLIEEEVAAIKKHQQRISFWEDRIEKNKTQIKKHEFVIRQNNSDALHNKKNRDYWFGRAEEVEIDYSHAEVSNRTQDWAWLIKKYGLKNPDGSSIEPKANCVEELCNGGTKDLSAEYRGTGNKYENARKEKENENSRLVRENAKLLNTNDLLQTYITSTYANEIEPLQDGILLLKELSTKLKSFEAAATYGDMRAWAEVFLNDFIKANSRLPQSVVTHFRRITSIPLPPENC